MEEELKVQECKRNPPLSPPMNIPKRSKTRDEDEEEEGGMVVPPHVMLHERRRSKREMAYSVCVGNGRTLKGRDLSKVRNSILKLTGFLESC
ncbi:hypothetical protein GIB67_038973 [Kingdonia uniflora]|uniref:Uncharacterized protein n=1 Tax=Kingdonia uniflora TaxID=39325 RepID=A0A7J7P6U1_9MAGN|nr:hypothetical protein GIB67_000229 [Kingdonia uniflora]KAF6175060.1 hypothetical protein GIB67_038973 [Kingdonia uniflora]